MNAASFAVAAILIASIKVERTQPPAERQRTDLGELSASIGSAFRSLWEDRLLRLLAIMLTVTNFGLMFGHGIFVKYADRELGVTGFGYGLLLVATALGAAAAGVFGHRDDLIPRDAVVDRRAVPRVRRDAGVDRRRSRSPAVVAVVGFVLGGSITLWNVVTLSIRQRVIEPARFGRVNSVYRWIGTGAGAFGALVGGQLAYATDSLRVPYLAAGVITLAALAVFAAPLLTRRARHRPRSRRAISRRRRRR